LSWQAFVHVRLAPFQPVAAISSLIPLLCVAAFTVVAL
jgi:hypothetical protein